MLTENTRNAFLCIELIDEKRLTELENALKSLAKEIQENLGGICTISILNNNNKEIMLEN